MWDGGDRANVYDLVANREEDLGREMLHEEVGEVANQKPEHSQLN